MGLEGFFQKMENNFDQVKTQLNSVQQGQDNLKVHLKDLQEGQEILKVGINVIEEKGKSVYFYPGYEREKNQPCAGW